jgi:hypothetical protein
MEGPEAGAPVVELPERVDRRVRLGPFPSARDALKFACYAAVGAVLSPLATPFAWLPALGAGFAFSVWRPEGEAVDERGLRWLAFQVQRRVGVHVTRSRATGDVRGAVARLARGRWVSVVRTGGVPLAYRPPDDLGDLFDQFRELLRATEGPLVLRSTTVPLTEGLVLPRRASHPGEEETARAGYSEFVSVLCRRRRSRRVEISLSALGPEAEASRDLDARMRSLAERLGAFGMGPVVLRGRALSDAVRGFGWAPARGAT